MSSPSEDPYERFLRAMHKGVFLIDRKADRLLADSLGGTFSQFLVLTAIAQCPGLSQQKIAEFLDLTPAAISRQIDTLVKAELIKSEEDPQSRRSHIISLMPAGEKRVNEMKTVLMEAFRKASPVAVEDLDAATETLERVVAAMHPGA
jgi:MarR family transcriptional regulator for hemolysin